MLTATAIKHYGSQANLARALGITRSAVSQWGRIVPEGTAYKIQSISAGSVAVDPKCYRRTEARSA